MQIKYHCICIYTYVHIHTTIGQWCAHHLSCGQVILYCVRMYILIMSGIVTYSRRSSSSCFRLLSLSSSSCFRLLSLSSSSCFLLLSSSSLLLRSRSISSCKRLKRSSSSFSLRRRSACNVILNRQESI